MVKRRQSQIPPGSWPPRMMAEMAAGYCGERHVEDFLDRVGKTYPLPCIVDTTRRKFWYRDDLDRAMGIGATPAEDSIGARFREVMRAKRAEQAAENERRAAKKAAANAAREK